MSAGNRSVLVVLDSRCVAARAGADGTVFAALDHFGVAQQALDCGDYMGLAPGYVAPRAAYVLAHDGVGAGLAPAVATQIAEAVRAGAGLLSFDRDVRRWPQCLQDLLPPVAGVAEVEALAFTGGPDFVTFGHEEGEQIALAAPVQAVVFGAAEGFESLLEAAGGGCVLARGRAGAGRVVAFGTGERLYAEGIFGHTRGLDGLLWRALVWAAAKPFPMRCIPPYLTAKMDDCNGAYSAFGWVESLNRFGVKPNLGLFIDEMGPSDWAGATRLFQQGNADFSMHAFRDDYYRAVNSWRGPYAPPKDKPDLSDGGKHTLYEGLSMDHTTGRDLDDETVRRNFRRMDDAFARAGIRHGRVINAHFGEVGFRAVPLFLERGVDLLSNNSVVGQLYGNQPPWRPRPYGVRGQNGRHGVVLDRCPQHPGLTLVGSSPSHLGKSHMVTDILSGHTPYCGESDTSRPEASITRGIANVRVEFDSLSFGEIMCHEERIDAISLEEWDAIVAGIVRGIADWDFVPAGREEAAVACKRLYDSGLGYADSSDAGLHCELVGQTKGPSPLTLWVDEGDGCRRTLVEVPRIDGFLALDLPSA